MTDDQNGPLVTMTQAVAVASLSNAGNAPDQLTYAYQLYGAAISRIRAALEDPVKVKSNQTLAAVMLLSTFEVIPLRIFVSAKLMHRLQNVVYQNRTALKKWSIHIVAAANLIDIRGPGQFGSESAIRMFLHIRRLIASFITTPMRNETDDNGLGDTMLPNAGANAISLSEMVSLGRGLPKH